MNEICCEFLEDDPKTFKEVSLEELLSLEDTSLTCDSEDGIWQYYMVGIKDPYFVKIKKDIVINYLISKDR